MQVHYYSYCFQDTLTHENKLFNFLNFIESSCLTTKKYITNNIKYLDENLYLIRVSKNFYLFIQTKNSEIVRAIQNNSINIQATDIAEKLNADESLGFASYVYIDGNKPLFSFGAKVLSPNITAFSFYVSQLLISLGIRDYKFCLNPIKSQLSKDDVHKLNFIGRTTIQINSEGSTLKEIMNALNGNPQQINLEEIEGLEITLKPKRRKDINNQLACIISNVADKELEKIKIRARANLEDGLADYYYSKDGLVSDFCGEETDALIEQKMKNLIENNSVVSNKVEKYIGVGYEQLENHSLVEFSTVDNWNR